MCVLFSRCDRERYHSEATVHWFNARATQLVDKALKYNAVQFTSKFTAIQFIRATQRVKRKVVEGGFGAAEHRAQQRAQHSAEGVPSTMDLMGEKGSLPRHSAAQAPPTLLPSHLDQIQTLEMNSKSSITASHQILDRSRTFLLPLHHFPSL